MHTCQPLASQMSSPCFLVPSTGAFGEQPPDQTSFVSGFFRGCGVLPLDDIAAPLAQTLHLASSQFFQVLLLHVQAPELGAKHIVGNVLLVLRLQQCANNLMTCDTSVSKHSSVIT